MLRKTIIITLAFTLVLTMTLGSAFGCTTIVVGKNKTADGSVMYAHSEELDGYDTQYFDYVPSQVYDPENDWWEGVDPRGVWGGRWEQYFKFGPTTFPQVARTYSYVASKLSEKNYNPGDYTFGVNEKQVTISNNIAYSRNYTGSRYPWDLVEGGLIWSEYTQLVLERASTAREGVELIAKLLDNGYTLSMDPGTMYLIADPNEGWVLEMHNEGQYVAQRVPDDGFYVISNVYSIGEIDFDDPDIYYSDDVVTHAIAKGWYTPAIAGDYSDFSFKDAYGNPSYQAGEWYNLRVREAKKMLNEAPVTVPKLMEIMRTCYEGTDYYITDANGSPFNGSGSAPNGHRVMSRLDTEMSAVVQLRPDLPPEIGTTMWVALATSKTSAYIPWYLGATVIPEQYQKGTNGSRGNKVDSAYWAYRDLSRRVHATYANSFPIVKAAWDAVEQGAFNKQDAIEAEALKIYKKSGAEAASRFLNDYSNSIALSAYDQAGDLLKKLNNQIPLNIELSAFVEKLNGNQNNLTIDLKEVYFNGNENDFTTTIKINNNSAGIYEVGGYKVYVDTKGNTQIRDCYIVN